MIQERYILLLAIIGVLFVVYLILKRRQSKTEIRRREEGSFRLRKKE